MSRKPSITSLPTLSEKQMKKYLDFIPVREKSKLTGYTTTAIMNWVKTKKLVAVLFNNTVMVNKDVALPPR